MTGVVAFAVTWRSIAWMVDGGIRDYVQLGALVMSLATGLCGAMMMCRSSSRT